MIEYVTARWNPYTGCLHGEAECPVYADCWARDMSKRFEAICGGDFKPRYHHNRLFAPLHWKKPRRVAVCFMGELGGNWPTAEAGLPQHMSCVRHNILQVVRQCPQHTFLFLTKNPVYYAEFNPWPSNAWVGMSLTGAEPPKRQAAMWEALHSVQGAGVRWLSYEPIMGPLAMPLPEWLDWCVFGGFSRRRATQQQWEWACDAEMHLSGSGTKFWEKENLRTIQAQNLRQNLRQDLPL